MSAGDEEGLFFPEAAQRCSWQAPVVGPPSADDCVAVVRLQVIFHRRGYGSQSSVPADVLQKVDGGTQQKAQGHQAEGDGGDQCWRGILWLHGILRLHGGLRDRVLTPGAHEALRTLAHRSREVVETRAAVVTVEQVAGALAHRAVLPGEAQSAHAFEVIDAVNAGAGIAAGVTGTVVNVGLAVRAGETWLAAAHDTFPEVQTLAACRGKKREWLSD